MALSSMTMCQEVNAVCIKSSAFAVPRDADPMHWPINEVEWEQAAQLI